MSHAWGVVFEKAEPYEVIAYFEYNGTCDVCVPAIWNTTEEMQEHWRENREIVICPHRMDEKKLTSVLLYTTYGNGYYWPGKVCLKCRLIVDGYEPDWEKEKEGRPDNRTEQEVYSTKSLEDEKVFRSLYPVGQLGKEKEK